ncbi:MAG: peptidase M22 [Verrucomicrobia bacterium]|nr:peptidase M22 [Verrucomicrobiota bacterium]
MPTLREALAHGGAVCLDAASARIQVGRLNADGTGTWCVSEEEAGIGVFDCLRRLEISPREVSTWIYCDGPGSVLGIRTVAAALRSWRVLGNPSVFSYCSLALVAHTLPDQGEIGVIADARRDSWHHYQVGQGLRRVVGSGLSGRLVMPEGFRSWSNHPLPFDRVPYDLALLMPRALDAPLLRGSDEPDAFLHEEPSYVTWTPQIHRGPVK